MTSLPDAEALLEALVAQMRPDITPDTALVGIHTGGAWLAERLHEALGIRQPLGTIDVAFYRDDYGERALQPQLRRSAIPFDMEGAPVILVDDVLFTGRTTRAALNELFDYGRPARVDLAVLVDRGERELPIAPRYCALTLPEPIGPGTRLQLEQADDGSLSLRLIDV
ncbi:bifunctional pyr operon transcriptional regulator/uracil phosphoribosyltransferase PyrR [Nitrogeniibacter mangrovi]|uniref:Bifunctional pyr operon transcriptional regulator/uracil phosphoribosyltransferase PyrR n=1 Tax=Nitrogeniibacter mangrovi TaxID=2016596 RepID=A0A6C1B0J0_9RHOO|nr:bifunctional pyr operon transcriptional regulator/uracil phosphoribosyltransferase PyrR [Nitrogeniibacter mangrovi]QID16893.1 bifunctional pyr operon transcriptional regulator/uracil phosphoribosyltransferase PyrR [Nitrogeniibacter mangrovi]